MIPDSRLDLLQKRAEYELDTQDDGRACVVAAEDVLELIDEVRALKKFVSDIYKGDEP